MQIISSPPMTPWPWLTAVLRRRGRWGFWRSDHDGRTAAGPATAHGLGICRIAQLRGMIVSAVCSNTPLITRIYGWLSWHFCTSNHPYIKLYLDPWAVRYIRVLPFLQINSQINFYLNYFKKMTVKTNCQTLTFTDFASSLQPCTFSSKRAGDMEMVLLHSVDFPMNNRNIFLFNFSCYFFSCCRPILLIGFIIFKE